MSTRPADAAQCRDVNRRGGLFIAVAAIAASLAIPSAASAAPGQPTLDLNGPKRPGLLDKIAAQGKVPGATAGTPVTVTVEASGRTVEKKQVATNGAGAYSFPFVVDACCNYQVTASSGGQDSPPQRFTVRVPKHVGKGALTRLKAPIAVHKKIGDRAHERPERRGRHVPDVRQLDQRKKRRVIG